MACSILIADDEKDFADTLAERLELRGYAVRVAHDGESALRAAEEHAPDVVVLDLFMPGMRGDVVIHALHMRYPQLPVVLLTGHACVTDEGLSPCAEAWACRTKPVALHDLIDLLEKAVAEGKVHE